MDINACVAANGFVIPPMFVVLGQWLNWDVMGECKIEGSVIYVSKKVFMSYIIFIKCLEHFENSVPVIVNRPLVLVYDGW